jgi:hypothetical protein
VNRSTQMNLLSIPRQPNGKPVAAIKSIQIRAYVREKLQGLSERQVERDHRRAEKRKPKVKLTMPTLFDMEPVADA